MIDIRIKGGDIHFDQEKFWMGNERGNVSFNFLNEIRSVFDVRRIVGLMVLEMRQQLQRALKYRATEQQRKFYTCSSAI